MTATTVTAKTLNFFKALPGDAARAPTDIRKPVILGLSVITLGLGSLSLWAATAPLDSAVVAQGVLVVESKRKTVQHLEGGIIKDILVRDGDVVRQGQPLVRLDNTRAVANLAMVQGQYDAQRVLEARLLAERDGLSEIKFPQDMIDRAATDPKVRGLMEMQKTQMAERAKSQDGQVGILKQRISQLQSELDGYKVLQGSKQQQLKIMNDEMTGLQSLVAKGYYPKNRVRELERDRARLEGDIGSDAANIARSEKSMGETQLQIIQQDQKFREDVVTQLREASTQVNDLRERLVSAQDTASRQVILSPESGVVQNMKIATSGGVIPAGGDLMDVVPAQDRLVIDARVQPTDVESIHSGETAEIRFPALASRTTPVIEGHVTTLSADRLTDPVEKSSYYATRVEVPREQLALLGDHQLRAGMPVEVMIKRGERTAWEYMVKPLKDGFAKSFKER